jgi:hypothetical protein
LTEQRTASTVFARPISLFRRGSLAAERPLCSMPATDSARTSTSSFKIRSTCRSCRPDWEVKTFGTCDTFEEAAQHLKLIFPEGEIDFIVAPPITNLSSEKKSVDMSEIGRPGPLVVDVEYPVEIALKKLVYRGRMLKVRDIFDIAVVDHYFSKLLHSNLVHVKDSQAGILARLKGISETFLRLELNELDISESWRREADTCLARVTAIMSGHA